MLDGFPKSLPLANTMVLWDRSTGTLQPQVRGMDMRKGMCIDMCSDMCKDRSADTCQGGAWGVWMLVWGVGGWVVVVGVEGITHGCRLHLHSHSSIHSLAPLPVCRAYLRSVVCGVQCAVVHASTLTHSRTHARKHGHYTVRRDLCHRGMRQPLVFTKPRSRAKRLW